MNISLSQRPDAATQRICYANGGMGASLSQKFIMCVLAKRGYFNGYDSLLVYGLVSAALIELQDEGAIVVWDKYAKVVGDFPDERPWLKRTYDSLVDPMNECQIGNTVRRLYSPLLTDKRFRITLEDYLAPLEERAAIKEGKRTGLFRRTYTVSPCACNRIRQDIEAQIACRCFDDAELLTLILLLRHSKLIRSITPHVKAGEPKDFCKRIDEVESGSVGFALKRNRDVISSVSFSMSFLGGGLL